jgi:hypothetical protein
LTGFSGILRGVRFAAALGLFVAFATALCPLRMCFGHEEGDAAPATPGNHGHEHHEGPDKDAGCCTDVPTETGGPWIVVQLALPSVGFAEPASAPRTPSATSHADATRVVPSRTTVLLR